jgi:hypothetical protein
VKKQQNDDPLCTLFGHIDVIEKSSQHDTFADRARKSEFIPSTSSAVLLTTSSPFCLPLPTLPAVVNLPGAGIPGPFCSGTAQIVDALQWAKMHQYLQPTRAKAEL